MERSSYVRQMPKAELHRHLAGCLSPEILLEVHHKFGVPLPDTTLDGLRRLAVLDRPMTSLREVLNRFELLARVFSGPDVVRFVARRVVEDAAADNVRYLELRFSPGFMSYYHAIDLEEVVEAVLEGSQEAARECGIVVPLITIATREFGTETCYKTFKIAARYRPHVVGVDLAGDEDGHPPRKFVKAFDFARSQGLRVTVHAGEQSNPENVAEAVEVLGAERIGHGILIIDRPDIMEMLSARRIPLEISITSNLFVGAVPSVEEHPVSRLRAAGVPITINSDDPALFGITLSHELELYVSVCGLGIKDLVQAQLDALEFGFATEMEKEAVRRQLLEWWGKWY